MRHVAMPAAGNDSLVPEFHPWIHLVHFIALCMLFALPISAFLLRKDVAASDITVASKLAGVLARMDQVAIAGAIILLLSGFAQMWAHHISLKDAFSSDQPWLGAKIVLFIVLLLNEFIFVGPAIRARVALLAGTQGRAGQEIAPQEQANLHSNYSRLQASIVAMVALLLAILVLVLFQPFTAHPR